MPEPGSNLIPSLRYRNAHAAIDFLVRAFGFTKNAVYEDANGDVAHAQLVLTNNTGRGMVMLSTANNTTEYGRLMSLAGAEGAKPTAALCLIVADAEAVYASARAAGAIIVSPLVTMEYGGRAFGCEDPEGNLWSIGEYDPWAPA